MQIIAVGEIYDMNNGVKHAPGDVFEECKETAEILILKGVAVEVEQVQAQQEKTQEKAKRGRKKAIQ